MKALNLESNMSQSFQGKHIIRVKGAQNWELPTQLINIPRFLGKNIKNCPPSKLFLITSLQRLGYWFQRYKQLKDWTNNKKQNKLSALFGCILKTVFASSDSFCLITSLMTINTGSM